MLRTILQSNQKKKMEQKDMSTYRCISKLCSLFCLETNKMNIKRNVKCEEPCISQGFWYFAEKKGKFRGIFRGEFAEKSADFAGFSREKKAKFAEKSADFADGKSKFAENQPISRDFSEKSQISKDFEGQVLRKIGRFHGKFRGETSPRNNQ